jgi:hypothetical protein
MKKGERNVSMDHCDEKRKRKEGRGGKRTESNNQNKKYSK